MSAGRPEADDGGEAKIVAVNKVNPEKFFTDATGKYCEPINKGNNPKFKCKLCKDVFTGSRGKRIYHIMKICPNATKEAKMAMKLAFPTADEVKGISIEQIEQMQDAEEVAAAEAENRSRVLAKPGVKALTAPEGGRGGRGGLRA